MKIIQQINKEIIHFAEKDTIISSRYRTIFIKKNTGELSFKLPEKNIIKRIFGLFRITRRLLRLDKCNVFYHQNNLVLIRQGVVYHYNSSTKVLKETLKLRNCRNVMHQSINSTPEGYIYFGEYGANNERTTVPVYRSIDGGLSWEEIYTFPKKSIKHVHGCYYDEYTDKIWVCTGDFKDESWLLVANKDFTEIKKIGDGQQKYRTCSIIFTKEKVHWLMDSPLEPSHHIIFDRKTEAIEVGQKLMGPAWYTKKIDETTYLATTTREIGPGVLDNNAHLYLTKDLKNWVSVKQFEKDGWTMKYFKFGIIGFADGQQSLDAVHIFLEAVKKYDGKSLLCDLS
ncbi:hypothetical protein [Maribacter sp. LLG6340-A2]|uniref:hypothetical protein n=1 Tax=Maribacter sp. LLG6340-A2 TaxID=3160834 RepID=UPI00386AF4A1